LRECIQSERTAIRQPGMEPSLFLGLHTRWGPARVDGLHSRRFSEPVTVHRTQADGTVHPTLIITTKEAYDAQMQTGPPVADPAWQTALDAFVRALLDPTPEKVEEGRVAFDRLYHPPPAGTHKSGDVCWFIAGLGRAHRPKRKPPRTRLTACCSNLSILVPPDRDGGDYRVGLCPARGLVDRGEGCRLRL
jgi:hypothetical protein